MIADILGLIDPPTSGLGWHDAVFRGLPGSCLAATAKWLEVEVADVASLVSEKVPAKTRRAGGAPGVALSPQGSNYLYRIAVAGNRLCGAGMAKDVASLWLRQPQPGLRGRVPVLLLGSHVGTEYVLTAIARMAAERLEKESKKKASSVRSNGADTDEGAGLDGEAGEG